MSKTRVLPLPLVAILLSLLSTGCNLAIGYQAPILPIGVIVNSRGEVSVHISHSVQTPIGTFFLEASQSIYSVKDQYNGERVLIVRVDSTVYVYRLEEGKKFDVEFSGNDTYYKKVGFKKEPNGDIILELVSVKIPTVAPDVLVVTSTSRPVIPEVPVVIPTSRPERPRMYNFRACASPCNGNNSSKSFDGGTTKIYVEWDYENIPYGADYQRVWRMDGQEWIRYSCTWTGPSSGHDVVKLTEPYGLHSGIWEMSIYVNGELLIQDSIHLTGNHTYWDPAGVVSGRCYGTVP